MSDWVYEIGFGFFASVVGAYYLIQQWRGRVRLTFRAGCYIWLILFVGLLSLCKGVSYVVTFIWNSF